jgi:hypothetical protein
MIPTTQSIKPSGQVEIELMGDCISETQYTG